MRLALQRRREVVDQRLQPDRRGPQAELAGVQAREIEQVVDDLRLAGITARSMMPSVSRCTMREPGSRAVEANASATAVFIWITVEWVLQLVRDHGEELVLHRKLDLCELGAERTLLGIEHWRR